MPGVPIDSPMHKKEATFPPDMQTFFSGENTLDKVGKNITLIPPTYLDSARSG